MSEDKDKRGSNLYDNLVRKYDNLIQELDVDKDLKELDRKWKEERGDK